MPDKLHLTAGPLTMVFERGEVRYIRFGEHEVLRRVYMAVRDRNWGTVPNPIANLSVEKSEGGFAISYDVVSIQGEIDFRWSATITGDAKGAVEWTMQGKAYSTFWRNRIGYCVLHPILECAGRPCIIEKPDGSRETGRFPEQVAPHQPFRNIRAMSHEVAPGLTAEVRFSGDVFETEDQRNWTDASYKTYSTPLDLPFPVEVKAGTVISQSVRLSLFDSIVFSYREADAVPLPQIGLGQGGELGAPEIARLRALNLSHLRADLDLAGDYLAALARAQTLGVPLELAITFSTEAELAAFAAGLRPAAPRVRRWLIFDENAVALARKHLTAIDPNAQFVCGTDANLAELSRNRPDPAALDGVCFSLNPQVHAFDNDSLVENLAGQADAVRSARLISAGKPVVVSPVTLKPRPRADDRQNSRFAAAWTVASLKYLAESGAASVTFYETTGPRGVMEPGGEVFPLYHVLADAGEFAGGEVLPSQSTRPLAVDGIVLRKGNRIRILVANMTGEMARVTVDGCGELALAPYAVERIDFERSSR